MINKPRKWWIAGLFSLIFPGLGQFYNGQIQKALVFLLIYLLDVQLIIFSFYFPFYKTILFSATILRYVLLFIFTLDAIFAAVKFKNEYAIKIINKPIVYILLIIVFYSFSITTALTTRKYLVQAYKIPTASMENTLLKGDRVFADKRSSAKTPKRGDIVVFKENLVPPIETAKRIIGLSGDLIEIKAKKIYINTKQIKENYVIFQDKNIFPVEISVRDYFGPIIVPDNCYFILGDNRDNSRDSRFIGVISKSNIQGTIKAIYWSENPTNGKVRWDRIGKKI